MLGLKQKKKTKKKSIFLNYFINQRSRSTKSSLSLPVSTSRAAVSTGAFGILGSGENHIKTQIQTNQSLDKEMCIFLYCRISKFNFFFFFLFLNISCWFFVVFDVSMLRKLVTVITTVVWLYQNEYWELEHCTCRLETQTQTQTHTNIPHTRTNPQTCVCR